MSASQQPVSCGLKTCSNEGAKFCSGCHRTKYCSRECQKKDWKKHESLCFYKKTAPQIEEMKQKSETKNSENLIRCLHENQNLVNDVIDFCLPKILAQWTRTPDLKGVVRIIFRSMEDINQLIENSRQGKTIEECDFSLDLGFSSLVGEKTVAEFCVWEEDVQTRLFVNEFTVQDNKVMRTKSSDSPTESMSSTTTESV
jgi:hypothetical protein